MFVAFIRVRKVRSMQCAQHPGHAGFVCKHLALHLISPSPAQAAKHTSTREPITRRYSLDAVEASQALTCHSDALYDRRAFRCAIGHHRSHPMNVSKVALTESSPQMPSGQCSISMCALRFARNSHPAHLRASLWPAAAAYVFLSVHAPRRQQLRSFTRQHE